MMSADRLRIRFPDVPEHVVAHFVAHHDKKLFAIQLRENRVPQHDALRAPEAGDVRVHGVGVLALGDLVDPAALDPRAIGEPEDVGFERLVFHRAECVEQRVDPDWLHQRHEDDERNRQKAGVQPPSSRAPAQQEVRHPHEQHTDDDADGEPGRFIAGPLAEGLIGETVRVLADESLVVGEREIDQEKDDCEGDEIEPDLEEPLPPRATGPVANASGDAGKQQQ